MYLYVTMFFFYLYTRHWKPGAHPKFCFIYILVCNNVMCVMILNQYLKMMNWSDTLYWSVLILRIAKNA